MIRMVVLAIGVLCIVVGVLDRQFEPVQTGLLALALWALLTWRARVSLARGLADEAERRQGLRTACGSCGGSGKRNLPGNINNGSGRCYSCHGSGRSGY